MNWFVEFELVLIVFVILVVWFVLFSVVAVYSGYYFNVGVVKPEARVWSSSFECGFLSHGVSENYFSFSYFLLLVFFVLFDLEVSLFLNVFSEGVLFKNFWYYSVFLFVLCLGYFFELEGGYVDWNI